MRIYYWHFKEGKEEYITHPRSPIVKVTKEEFYVWENDGLSEGEIADKLSISRQGLFNLRKRIGWKKKRGRSDKGKDRVDPKVRKENWRRYMREYQRKLREDDTKTYKNIRVTRDGISVVRQEHRVVMEKKLGRLLRPEELVHHLDGNCRNNDPENLVLTNSSEHINKYHRGIDKGHTNAK